MKPFRSLLFLFVAVFAVAQQPVPVSAQSTSATVAISVLDKNGRAVSDLKKDELAVEFDGRDAQVAALAPAVDSPYVYAILVDCSGSTRDKAAFMRDYALDLLKLAANGRNVGGLILFSSDGTDVVDTTTLDAARQALANRWLHGGTPLYDALIFGADALAKLARPGQAKVLFVLTDGEDNASAYRLDATLSRLQADAVRVFALGLLGNSPATPRAKKALQELAEETGGAIFVTSHPNEKFVPQFDEALAATVNVTFRTTAVPDGKEHPIRVRALRKDARVVAPKSYVLAR